VFKASQTESFSSPAATLQPYAPCCRRTGRNTYGHKHSHALPPSRKRFHPDAPMYILLAVTRCVRLEKLGHNSAQFWSLHASGTTWMMIHRFPGGIHSPTLPFPHRWPTPCISPLFLVRGFFYRQIPATSSELDFLWTRSLCRFPSWKILRASQLGRLMTEHLRSHDS
jgi:hypothetical protein